MQELKRHQRDDVFPLDHDKVKFNKHLDFKLNDKRRIRDDLSMLRMKKDQRRNNFLDSDLKLDDLQTEKKSLRNIKNREIKSKDYLNQDLDYIMNMGNISKTREHPGSYQETPICQKTSRKQAVTQNDRETLKKSIIEKQSQSPNLKRPISPTKSYSFILSKETKQSSSNLNETITLQPTQRDIADDIQDVSTAIIAADNSDPIEESLNQRVKFGGQINSVISKQDLQPEIKKQKTNKIDMESKPELKKRKNDIKLDESAFNNREDFQPASTRNRDQGLKISLDLTETKDTPKIKHQKSKREEQPQQATQKVHKKKKITQDSKEIKEKKQTKDTATDRDFERPIGQVKERLKEDLSDDPIALAFKFRELFGSNQHVLTENELKKVLKLNRQAQQPLDQDAKDQQLNQTSRKPSVIQMNNNTQSDRRESNQFEKKNNRENANNIPSTIDAVGEKDQRKGSTSAKNTVTNQQEQKQKPKRNKGSKMKDTAGKIDIPNNSFEETVIVSSTQVTRIHSIQENFKQQPSRTKKQVQNQSNTTTQPQQVKLDTNESEDEMIIITTKSRNKDIPAMISNKSVQDYQKSPQNQKQDSAQSDEIQIQELQLRVVSQATRSPFVKGPQKAKQIIQLDDSLDDSPKNYSEQELIQKFNTQKIIDIEAQEDAFKIMEQKESENNSESSRKNSDKTEITHQRIGSQAFEYQADYTVIHAGNNEENSIDS
ncbi:UNKNOWN [Stylonychia lemnae]|uniref:Uncharacterized protein n=1 Tax=Stylonychia lemnae TaxID=5949 RepID=A0A078B4U5_STYLE|nr:UNKNOWN [Stylonychia lemnae]|eukprot:CDW89444.1 UNKNOWN [Stylonychia lemnae]